LIGSASGNVNSDKVAFTNNQFTGPADVGLKLLNNGVSHSRFAGNTFSGTKLERDQGLADPRLRNSWSKTKAKTPP